MSSFKVTTPCGVEKDGFETLADANDGAELHTDLCDACNDPDAAVIEPVGVEADGGPTVVEESEQIPPEVHEQQHSTGWTIGGTYRAAGIDVEVFESDEGFAFQLPNSTVEEYADEVDRLGMALLVAEVRHKAVSENEL